MQKPDKAKQLPVEFIIVSVTKELNSRQAHQVKLTGEASANARSGSVSANAYVSSSLGYI